MKTAGGKVGKWESGIWFLLACSLSHLLTFPLPAATNPFPVRTVILMLPSDYDGSAFNAVYFDPQPRDGVLRLWARTATEGGGAGGTNVAGITNLNGITNASQTFATGTSGSDFNIASAGTVHTWHLPTASSFNRGALSPGDWATFNNKQSAITWQTSGVTMATAPTTVTWNSGLTGAVSGSTLTLGVSASGSGGVATNAISAVLTNGVVVSSVATQLNLVSSGGIRFDVTDASGAVTVTPKPTNAFGLVFTNGSGNNVSQTNNITFSIPQYATNVTVNSDGLTVSIGGYYFVHGQVSYGLTANDWVGMVITTNDVDYPPSYITHYYDTASGGNLLYTNQMTTSAVIRLVANDRVRLKRWYGNGAGNIFQTVNASMSAFRVGELTQ